MSGHVARSVRQEEPGSNRDCSVSGHVARSVRQEAPGSDRDHSGSGQVAQSDRQVPESNGSTPGEGEGQGPGRRMGEDVTMNTGRIKRDTYTPRTASRRVKAQEMTESRRYLRQVWDPKAETAEDKSEETSLQDERDEERAGTSRDNGDEYWFEMPIEDMAMYDTDQIHQVHYLRRALGEYPEYNDDEMDSTSGGSVDTQVGRRRLVDTEVEGWAKVFKLRVRRTAKNPTIGMLMKDADLRAHWGPIIQEQEYKPMVAKGTLKHITVEEVGDETVTPHVTTMLTKDDGREKARINYHGAFEVRRGLCKERDLLYAPTQKHECTRRRKGGGGGGISRGISRDWGGERSIGEEGLERGRDGVHDVRELLSNGIN